MTKTSNRTNAMNNNPPLPPLGTLSSFYPYAPIRCHVGQELERRAELCRKQYAPRWIEIAKLIHEEACPIHRHENCDCNFTTIVETNEGLYVLMADGMLESYKPPWPTPDEALNGGQGCFEGVVFGRMWLKLLLRPYAFTVIGQGKKARFLGKPIGGEIQKIFDRCEGRSA